MSHFARVHNGKIIDHQNGIDPTGEDWVEVVKKWAMPTEYPSDFYYPTSNRPHLAIVKNEIHETWGFTLKPVDSIKEMFYEEHKKDRHVLQIGSFVYDEQDILIGDRETSFIIMGLPEVTTNYKLSNGKWLTLSPSDVVIFKEAHREHVQGAYDWEKTENEIVAAMTTLDELKSHRDGD